MSKDVRTTKHEQWRVLIDEQAKSGLSQSEFCKQRKLILSQFFYYRNRLVKTEQKNKPATVSSFVPIQLNHAETKMNSEIKLWLPNGFQCAFPSHIDAQQAKHWLEVLLSC